MRRWKMRTAAAFAMAAAVFLMIVSPQVVSAGLYDGYCDYNEVCVYKDANFGVPRSDFRYFYDDMDGGLYFHTYNYPPECNSWMAFFCRLNDSISSVQNLSDHRSVRIFTDAHYDGYYQTIGRYWSVSQVMFNDQTSSECWNDTGVPPSVDPDCTFANP